MRLKLQFSKRLSIVSLLLASPLLGQTVFGGAKTAVKGPEYDVSLGYSYAAVNFSGKPTVNMQGVDLGGEFDFTPRWGAAVDSTYLRAGRDLRTGHGNYLLGFLAGPVFVPFQNDNNRVLVRALAGVSLLDGSVPDGLVPPGELYYRGWLTRFAWAVGAGVEHNISGPFALRVNVDYLRTRFVSSALTVQPQNNVRVSGSLVYRFSARRR